MKPNLLTGVGALLVIWTTLAASGSESRATSSPELALRVGADGLKNVIVRDGAAWRALTAFDRPHHIYDYAVSPDGKRAFVWHMDVPPRKVSLYDLDHRRLVSRFRPGFGGSLRWTAANTLLHIWGIGTAVRIARVYDTAGRTLLTADAEAFVVSPSTRYLAAHPYIIGRQRLRVWDLVSNRKVIDRPTEGEPWFSVDVQWDGDRALRVRYEDRDGKTKVVPLSVPGRTAAAARSTFALSVFGQSLFLREGGEDRVLLTSVKPGAEDSGSSEVRRVHSHVMAANARAAAVLLTLNRQACLLPIRLDDEGRLEYGRALRVPGACEASFSPGGDALVLVSTRDTYLPANTRFRLNRGAMYLRLSEIGWHPFVADALKDPAAGRWYGRPETRFVARGDFEVLGLRWLPDACVLNLRGHDRKESRVTLR